MLGLTREEEDYDDEFRDIFNFVPTNTMQISLFTV